MSTLWAPDGEHQVEPETSPTTQDTELSPEDQERAQAMAEDMAAARQQIAQVPASMVVNTHLMGFFELAAIHLSNQPPNLPEAALAIDALGAVVDKLAGRLGEDEETLRDSLQQIRLAYVGLERQSQEEAAAPADGEENPDA